MKIDRLSSTEVANISTLPIEKRREALLRVEEPSVWWNYNPIKDALPKLLLAESGLFGHLPPDADSALIDSIAKSCRSGLKQRAACIAVAEAIVNWRKENSVTGRIVSPEPFRMSVDTLRYCADVAAVIGDSAYVIYLDPRSSMTLSRPGVEFVKSLIHHTALIGDLRSAKMALLRTPKTAPGVRRAVFEPLVGEPLYSLNEIFDRISETYSIWETILRGRKSGKATEGGSI